MHATNAILFGALSLGLITVAATRQPDQLADAARYAADDLEVARLMEAAPDAGFIGETVIADPETGERITVDTLAFNDAE